MIDLAKVRNQLENALDIVGNLDGLDLVDTDTGNPTNSHARTSDRQRAAAASRELLHLADLLTLSAALVREQYWTMKGLE